MEQAAKTPRILVIGFPKSGTTTLNRAFTRSGLKSVHWRHEGRVVGQEIYDGWFEDGDPLARFEGVDAITQMDFCVFGNKQERRMRSLWPNLDIPLLLAIRDLHPSCRFILNYREPAKTADSMIRWYDKQERLVQADCPGLPRGRGDRAELERWIATHVAAVRRVFAEDPGFLDLDIAAPDARERLEAFLGLKLAWWGVANRNRGRRGR